MITKEQRINRYCCLYVSDFHLEMILLPYIKNNIHKSNVIIFTEKNLVDTIKTLLDRTNLKIEDKNKILELRSWTNKTIENIKTEELKNYKIIINGDKKYIDSIENKISKLNYEEIDIIHCLDLNKNEWNITEINKNYNNFLNTKNICK